LICLADNTIHEDLAALHKHIRSLKITQEFYYTKYYNKRDLLTGEEIPFKNAEQYLSTDFLNKNNIRKYVKEQPEAAKVWAINWLKNRKEKKSLVYAPTQAELRSLQCPSIKYYDSVGGYENICSQIGLKVRYNGSLKYESLGDATIIQDTREQNPLKLKRKTVSKKLDAGDYGLEEKFDKKIYIERKGLSDFLGTMVTKENKNGGEAKFGVTRFRAELDRAKASGSYIIMLVESDINDALGFQYLPQTRYTRATPEHIFKNLRSLIEDYSNFQVVFVNGRVEAAKILERLFEAGESVKNVDLQYAYETGELSGEKLCG
jgi:ERCC4-type nuclease